MCAPPQNTKKTIISWLLSSLQDDGLNIVSAMLRDPRMYIAGSKKLTDITRRGGFASMTGMDIWQLTSIFPLVTRVILYNETMMVGPPRDTPGV